jgi:beta-phosphoglucomutase
MTNNRQRGVIFDLDGVLTLTGPAHQQSWSDLAEQHECSMTDEFFRNTFGMQNYQIIPLLLGREASPQEIAEMSEQKEVCYRRIVASQLQAAPGVLTLLADLKQQGFALAIGSSAPQANVDLAVNTLDIRAFFQAIVTGEQVTQGKPAPDTFLLAAQELGLDPGQCVVVEDAVQGVAAGKSAGMAVIAVTTTRERADLNQADRIVDSLSEVTAQSVIRLLHTAV